MSGERWYLLGMSKLLEVEISVRLETHQLTQYPYRLRPTGNPMLHPIE
jgi:hypothetical protein